MKVNSPIRDIRLAEIPYLVAQLATQISLRMRPDVVIYLEEGARVPAVHLARQTGWPLWPLRIQRSDSRWKRLVRPVLQRLPVALVDRLRRAEASHRFERRSPRVLVEERARPSLQGCRVVIFDDAADSGSTLLMAREWAQKCGARPEDVLTAVLTVTTGVGREVVDCALFQELCRFPWSADSAEAREHARLHAQWWAEVETRLWSR